jgi:hypothetical protein
MMVAAPQKEGECNRWLDILILFAGYVAAALIN